MARLSTPSDTKSLFQTESRSCCLDTTSPGSAASLTRTSMILGSICAASPSREIRFSPGSTRHPAIRNDADRGRGAKAS
jgi:hypothetical protein